MRLGADTITKSTNSKNTCFSDSLPTGRMFACRKGIFPRNQRSSLICPRILYSDDFAFANVILLEDRGYLMLFHHSRPAKRVRRAHCAKAFAALASGLFLSLGALSVFSPQKAAAQTQPQTQVSFTYLQYRGSNPSGPTTPIVTTDFSTPVGTNPGFAFISVQASFTGRGYGFGGGGDRIGPGDFGGQAEVADGDAFIVTPIIDPDLNVNYVLHNESGIILDSLTFTLDPDADLYFFDNGTIGTPNLRKVTFSNSVGETTFQNLSRTGYKTLTFSSLTVGDVIGINGISTFNFSMHIPDGRQGQQFAAVLSPNNFTPLASPTAPEPGTLMLLVPVGIMLGTVAKARRRRRVL